MNRHVEAIRETITDMTGVEPVSCPWRAFSVPIVREVMHAVQFHESGNLAFALPTPSHKLVEALAVWNQVYNRVQAKQMELELERRRKNGAGNG